MNPALHEGADLARAFERFTDVAAHLEARHRQLLDRVAELETHLVAVLDAVDSGVAVVDADGRRVRTNRAFDALELDDATLDDGRGTARLCAHGRDLVLTATPADDRGTRVLTVKDVTDVRREEEEGGRRRRLEALGRMAAEVAHEVRNPLGSIRLFASMLRDDLADLEEFAEQRGMTEQILSATAGLEATVSNLLGFASPSGGRRARVDLAAIAREACALLAPACAVRGVHLVGPDADARCPVDAEPEGTRQILLNLVGNALAAVEGAGRIEVEVVREGTGARLIVRDDGRGIPDEDLPRVFDPFFTRSESGSGLGLSIVHGIVERHGGRIRLDSEAGVGTTAAVELPGATEAEHD